MRFPIFFADLGFYSPKIESNIKTKHFDISPLENAFSRGDFGEIIENPRLFWQAFCKAFNQVNSKGNSCDFSVSIHGKNLSISGKDEVIYHLGQCIEEIRTVFIKKSLRKHETIILPIQMGEKYFIKQPKELIDLNDQPEKHHVTLYKGWFEGYIKPSMQGLFESLGAIYSEEIIFQDLTLNGTFASQGVRAIKINYR